MIGFAERTTALDGHDTDVAAINYEQINTTPPSERTSKKAVLER